jgi:hypothetical protein
MKMALLDKRTGYSQEIFLGLIESTSERCPNLDTTIVRIHGEIGYSPKRHCFCALTK